MKLRSNNKGMTLFELIIVIAIIAIATALAAFTLSIVNNANVAKAANRYAYAVDLARNTSMAKGKTEGTLNIKLINNKYYYYIGSPSEASPSLNELCSAGSITVTGLTNGMTIQFNQAGMVAGASAPIATFTRGKRHVTVTVHKITGKSEVTTTFL